MNPNEYQRLVRRTALECPSWKEYIKCCQNGFTSEIGEVAGIIKKYLYHGHPISNRALSHELALEVGDICWYAAEMAFHLGYSFEEILEMNISKLKDRYPEGFSTERSINRDR